MNIQSLIAKAVLFEELVLDSGFKRDLDDYREAISESYNQNLIYMKNITDKVMSSLKSMISKGLDTELKHLITEKKTFLELDTISELNEINSNSEIGADPYHTELESILESLSVQLNSNIEEVNEVIEILSRYESNDDEASKKGDKALVSLIFKDLKTTKSLKEFSIVLNRWNKALLMYHTLIMSESPESIGITEIQNGSIDVIIDIGFDVAINLVELIELGLKTYGVYLVYKSKTAKEIFEVLKGNKKFLELEKQKEEMLLEEIKESSQKRLMEQHKKMIKKDKGIEKEGVQKKIDYISSVITDHIIKGNEVKLLISPVSEEEIETDEGQLKIISNKAANSLKNESLNIKEQQKYLSESDKTLLLNKYNIDEIKEE